LKFRRGGKTLVTLYARDGYFKVNIVFGKDERTKFEECQAEFCDAIRKIYEDANTYHDGKWLWIDICDDTLFDDIARLLKIKRKPNRKAADVYQHCPTLHTEHFALRLVQEDDAADLLCCYSDPKSQAIFDFENCTSDFRYSTIEEMVECIRHSWLEPYSNKEYVRWSIMDRQIDKAIGTVEMFSVSGFFPDEDGGVLRIDIASRYETEEYLSELLQLANQYFYDLFGAEMIAAKGKSIAELRIKALLDSGYTPYDWPSPDREHYYIRRRS